MFGSGKQTRDFIHAEDIADGICRALTTKNVNAIYNLSTQSETDINSILSIFSRVSGKEVDFEHAPERQGDIFRSSLSNRFAISQLDWKPRISLEDGIERTYKYFLHRISEEYK